MSCAHVCVTLALKRVHIRTHTMRCVMLRAKHGIHVIITYLPSPHHCLPIDTWFDCPVQHPTCGCIAGVLCLAHCVRFIFCDPTDHPGAGTYSSSFRDLHDVFIDGPREKTTFPLQCRNVVLDFVISSTSPIFTSLTFTLPNQRRN